MTISQVVKVNYLVAMEIDRSGCYGQFVCFYEDVCPVAMDDCLVAIETSLCINKMVANAVRAPIMFQCLYLRH